MNLEKDGIQIFPSVFTHEEMDELIGAAESVIDATNPLYKHRYKENAPSGTPAIRFWPSLINPVFEKYTKDPRFISIVTGILGKDVKRLNNQFYYRYPEDGDQFAWHTDMRFRGGEGNTIREDYLQTAIICDDWTEENGAVEYLLGSHKKHFADGGQLRVFARGDLKGTKVFPKKGDVVVWSVAIIHGSEENKSDTPRRYLMNGLARAKATNRWPWLLKDGMLQDIDHTLIP